MPLIHDNPWLVSQLLQSAVSEDERLRLYKLAQTDPDTFKQIGDALVALLGNLKSQITPSTDPNEVGDMGNTPIDLFSHNMVSMGDLIEWLLTHGTPVGGKPVVVAGNQPRPGENYDYYRIEPGTKILTALEPPDQQRPTRPERAEVGYWVNSDGLKSYLVGLQKNPKLKNNVMFQVQLLKLVQFANDQLGSGISETYQAPAIDDGKEVDRLPMPLDPRQWNAAGDASNALLFKNIKSLEELNAWFGQGNRGYLVGQKTVTIKDQEWNICVPLNILKIRAAALYQRRTAESAVVMQAYVKQVDEIQRQANCSGGGGQQQPGGQPGQGGRGSQLTARALVGLATLKPFNTQKIDFQEMTTFLDKYLQLKPDMEGLVLQAKNAMQQANGVMNSPGAPFPMGNITKQSLESRTRNPAYLLQYLHTVVDVTGRVYMDFFNECQNVLRDLQGGSGIIAGVEEQVAAGGPYQMNLSDLERLQEQYPASPLR